MILETAPQERGKKYALSVTGVKDRSNNRNASDAKRFEYLCKPGTFERSAFIARWALVGPFPRDWSTNHVGEGARPSPGDPVAAKPGDRPEKAFAGEKQWQAVDCEGRCILDFAERFGRLDEAAAYVNTYVYSDRARDVLARLDSNDGNRVWLNGRAVFSDPTPARSSAR